MTHISEQGVAALVKVAEWLESGAHHVVIDVETNLEIGVFDMEYAVVANNGNECGTACCIAGAVCQFEKLGMDERDCDGDLEWYTPNERALLDTDKKGAFILASDHLGINLSVAHQMFMPFGLDDVSPDEYNNPAIAAKVIRNFIATGCIDWDFAATEWENEVSIVKDVE